MRGSLNVCGCLRGQSRKAAILHFILIIMACAISVTERAWAGQTLRFKNETVDTRATAGWSAQPDLEPSLSPHRGQKSFFVIQFKSTIQAADKKLLMSHGARLARYVPDDALIVWASRAEIDKISQDSSKIQTVLRYRPQWKVARTFVPPSIFSAQSETLSLVRLFPTLDASKVEPQLSAIPGVVVEYASGQSIVVRATRSQIEKAAMVEGIEWIEPLPQMRPMLMERLDDGLAEANADDFNSDYSNLTGYESGTKLMNFSSVWARGFNGQGQSVSMADSGLDLGTVETLSPNFKSNVSVGFAFGMFAKTWEDPMGHGTHVAGSVVGTGNLSDGKLRGGAFGAQFVPQGMWSPLMGNLTVPPRLADLFSKAYGAGARIHTNSWGTPQNLGAYDGFAQQVDEYMAENRDILIIYAAGNSGVDDDKDGRIDFGSITSPGTAKNTLTVGASKNLVHLGGIQKKLKEMRVGQDSWSAEPLGSSMLSENPQGLAPFSSRGPTLDGRLKPEVVAPGTNVLSDKSQHEDAQVLWGSYNKFYVWSGGTSMSTPLVAGAAAIVRQYLVQDRKIGNPSAALLKAVLMHTATDLFPGQFGEIGKERGQEILGQRPDNDQGYGRVNVESATQLSGATLVDETHGLAVGESKTYTFQVPSSPNGNVIGAGRFTATLVYTDAPGAVGAARALVNDLDLEVVGPNGGSHSLQDRVNNSEMIEIDAKPGAYEIRVKALNVPQGPAAGRQPFALVISTR